LGTDAERKTEKQSMRPILSRSLLTVAAASSILAATGGYASADTGTEGTASGSPGLLSGDSVQAPIDVPVNACGNTVDVVAAVNPAFGNDCANHSQSSGDHTHTHSAEPAAPTADHGYADGYAGQGYGDGYADEYSGQSNATGSPGVLSGNSLDIPVHAPVNACGNTVDPLALLNPAMGNSCGSVQQEPGVSTPPQASTLPAAVVPTSDLPVTSAVDSRSQPAPQLAPQTYPQAYPPASPQLAETGGGLGGRELGVAGATSAALLLGGAMLYRRGARPAPVVRRG